MLSRTLVLVPLLLAGSLTGAAELDLSVSNDSARLAVSGPVRGDNVQVEGSLLHHQDNGNVLGVAGYLTGAAAGGNAPLEAGLGLKLSWIDHDRGLEEDGGALAIGGFLRYTLPEYDRFAVGGGLYYAPDVLSFGDVQDHLELSGWASYSVIRQAELYLGWRSVKTDFDDEGEVTLDTGFHLGLRARF